MHECLAGFDVPLIQVERLRPISGTLVQVSLEARNTEPRINPLVRHAKSMSKKQCPGDMVKTRGPRGAYEIQFTSTSQRQQLNCDLSDRNWTAHDETNRSTELPRCRRLPSCASVR